MPIFKVREEMPDGAFQIPWDEHDVYDYADAEDAMLGHLQATEDAGGFSGGAYPDRNIYQVLDVVSGEVVRFRCGTDWSPEYHAEVTTDDR